MDGLSRMGELENTVVNMAEDIARLEEKVDRSVIQTNDAISSLANSVERVNSNVDRLCERDIRADERKQYEDEWKERIEENQKEQGKRLQNIIDDRNRESQGREFLAKYWPILFVVAIVATGVITKTFVK